MAVSSELPLAAHSSHPALFAQEARTPEPAYGADEEFPADLPPRYELILQHACRRSSPRPYTLIAVTLVSVLIAGCLAYGLPKLAPSVLASPSSSSPLSR